MIIYNSLNIDSIMIYMEKLNDFFLSNPNVSSTLYTLSYHNDKKNSDEIISFIPKIINNNVIMVFEDYLGYAKPYYYIECQGNNNMIIDESILFNMNYLKFS